MGERCMVWGSPCMCMRQMPQLGCAATVSRAPGCRSAQMSLMMSAPMSSACRMTSGLWVSTEMGIPSVTASRSTGTTRASSSSVDTGSVPGRLDSPPMSRMWAPSTSSLSQCASAERVLA